MAGFYPDVPAKRFAYHLDGTKMFFKDAADILYDATTSAAILNDEDDDVVSGKGRNALIFIFPELRNFSAYFIAGHLTPQTLSVSADTTNGLDGTWTTVSSPWVHSGSGYPSYRNSIDTVSAGLVKAIRFGVTPGPNYPYDIIDFYQVHLYGSIPSTENPDRLIFWEPTADNETPGAYFDWGDIEQGTSQIKTFRIKNNSATMTANDVALSSGTATHSMTVEFSMDDNTYGASVNIGNLAPGATSSVIYLRRSVPAAEPLRAQAAYLRATAGSWT